MNAPAKSTKRSVFAHAKADMATLSATGTRASSSFSQQGRTTHFVSSYSNGLLVRKPGEICRLSTQSDWRTSWSIIDAGNFSGRPFQDLLFYDPAAGVGEFYITEGGNVNLLKTLTDWRKSWSIILPCNLTGGKFNDLLFYDAGAGLGEMYTTDGHGNITLL